jgi:hypothetical protein
MKKPSRRGKKKVKSKSKTLETLYNPDHFPIYPLKIDYDPKFHPAQFVAYCREGKTPNEVAAQWGISKRKLQEWVVNDPDFKEAFRIGRDAFNAFYDDIAKKMMMGKMFFPQAKIFEKFAARYCDWRDDSVNPFEEILFEDAIELELVYKDVGNDSKT